MRKNIKYYLICCVVFGLILLSFSSYIQPLYDLATQFTLVKIRNLNLTSVATGSATDSILVKNNTNTIFKVPRSGFASTTDLSSYVPITRTIAGIPLSANITLNPLTKSYGLTGLTGIGYDGSAPQAVGLDSALILTKGTYQNVIAAKRFSIATFYGPQSTKYQGNSLTDLSVQQYNSRFTFSNPSAASKYVSFGSSLLTADRIYEWPDKPGTVALTSDLAQIVEVSGTTQALSVGNTYIFHNTGTITATLPANPSSNGGLITLIVDGVGRLKVAQNASQFISVLGTNSTAGTTGYIQTNADNATISLRYVNTNKFSVTASNSTPVIF